MVLKKTHGHCSINSGNTLRFAVRVRRRHLNPTILREVSQSGNLKPSAAEAFNQLCGQRTVDDGLSLASKHFNGFCNYSLNRRKRWELVDELRRHCAEKASDLQRHEAVSGIDSTQHPVHDRTTQDYVTSENRTISDSSIRVSLGECADVLNGLENASQRKYLAAYHDEEVGNIYVKGQGSMQKSLRDTGLSRLNQHAAATKAEQTSAHKRLRRRRTSRRSAQRGRQRREAVIHESPEPNRVRNYGGDADCVKLNYYVCDDKPTYNSWECRNLMKQHYYWERSHPRKQRRNKAKLINDNCYELPEDCEDEYLLTKDPHNHLACHSLVSGPVCRPLSQFILPTKSVETATSSPKIESESLRQIIYIDSPTPVCQSIDSEIQSVQIEDPIHFLIDGTKLEISKLQDIYGSSVSFTSFNPLAVVFNISEISDSASVSTHDSLFLIVEFEENPIDLFSKTIRVWLKGNQLSNNVLLKMQAWNSFYSETCGLISVEQLVFWFVDTHDILTPSDQAVKSPLSYNNLPKSETMVHEAFSNENNWTSRSFSAGQLSKRTDAHSQRCSVGCPDPDPDAARVASTDVCEPNLGAAICSICYLDFQPDNDHLTSLKLQPCSHVFCHACWSFYVYASVKSGRADISCMADACKTLLSSTDILFLTSYDLHKTYLTCLQNRTVALNKSLSWCPSSGCDKIIEGPISTPARSLTASLSTPVQCCCGKMFCPECHDDPHYPLDCQTFQLLRKQIETEIKTRSSIPLIESVQQKRCPRCRVRFEKWYGCDHVTCSSCSLYFCWRCLTPFSEHRPETCKYVDFETIELPYNRKVKCGNEHLMEALRWHELFVRPRTRVSIQSRLTFIMSTHSRQKDRHKLSDVNLDKEWVQKSTITMMKGIYILRSGHGFLAINKTTRNYYKIKLSTTLDQLKLIFQLLHKNIQSFTSHSNCLPTRIQRIISHLDKSLLLSKEIEEDLKFLSH